jgi:hypothetical protein
MKELIMIQQGLKAPKNQRNTFGNYNYRSAEDILEAVKPLLAEQVCTLTISDEMVEVGNRVYVRATVTLTSEKESVQTTAFAREEETKKGMDAAQITGSASSYARKYALNGLFCIDDTKDPDSTNKHEKEEEKEDGHKHKNPAPKIPEQKYASEPPRLTWTAEAVMSAISSAKTVTDLTTAWNNSDSETQIKLKQQFSEKRKELTHA